MAPVAIITEEFTTKSRSKASTQSPSAVLHRSIRDAPHKVIAASGNYLTLSNGQQILDATGGAAVACIGHSNVRVKKAMLSQMNEVSYCHSLFFGSSGTEQLAKELIWSTRGEMSKAFIVSSGSEAMEAAMKLSRQYFLELSPSQPRRTNFIARKESYHGTTLGSLSMGGHLARRKIFEPMLLHNTSHISACNTYHGLARGETVEDYVERLAQELEDEFQRLGPETVCAFVAEPVVGAASGCVPAVRGYFEAMRGVCRRHGALLIFDEVMCGMGRTGTLHAWEQEGVVPDIQTIGKGLGGGYSPIAAVLINHRIVDALDRGSGSFCHGQTYQGHPVACAAAAEVQRIIRENNLVENVKIMGRYLAESLRKRLGQHLHVGDIRGRGLFWGIEFVKDRTTKTPFDPTAGVAMAIHNRAISADYGISLYPGTGCVDGVRGDHIIIAPAYNVSREDVDVIVDLTTRVIEDVFGRAEFGRAKFY
ncbi:MAG: hypothetical protein M1833_005537 [Piccolia ochrophora]|nr:MAG: hypothetical protein M1833_005537 [Piccolia ochrophora]